MSVGLSGRLQHPRRSLGERHRTQSARFIALADGDESRAADNLAWAEQHARQALLHDFTQEENWHHLGALKVRLADEVGLRSLLGDLFAVLGRDPEQISQLAEIDILSMGCELLNAAFTRDPLEPGEWWTIHGDHLDAFRERFETLDLTDPRCNVLFGRRLERVKAAGHEELFIPLARKLLSQRPQNHEMWTELGRLHERREEFDEAWFCYDQAQQHAGHLEVREQFRQRMEARLDDGEKRAWSAPPVADRAAFLEKMTRLALRVQEPSPSTEEVEQDIEEKVDQDKVELEALLEKGEWQAAFFLARRLITRGEDWATEYLERAQTGLESQDEVHIP